MNIILAVILGMAIWQFIVFILILFLPTRNEDMMIISAGVWGIIWFGLKYIKLIFITIYSLYACEVIKFVNESFDFAPEYIVSKKIIKELQQDKNYSKHIEIITDSAEFVDCCKRTSFNNIIRHKEQIKDKDFFIKK